MDIYTARPLEDVKPFTISDYVPGGMTALHDAIGRSIRATERAERSDDRVIVVIMTDGHENSSHEWNKRSILKLIEEKRADGWDFVYLGAGEESWAGAMDLGFEKNQVINYGKSAYDHTAAIQDVAMASSHVTRSARGSRASESYLAVSPTKARLEAKAKKAHR